jgi:hypothetical protein
MLNPKLLEQTDALRQAMQKAEELAEAIYKNVPAKDEPAVAAQANVLRVFLHQVQTHEKLLSQMISVRQKS